MCFENEVCNDKKKKQTGDSPLNSLTRFQTVIGVRDFSQNADYIKSQTTVPLSKIIEEQPTPKQSYTQENDKTLSKMGVSENYIEYPPKLNKKLEIRKTAYFLNNEYSGAEKEIKVMKIRLILIGANDKNWKRSISSGRD